MQRAYHNPSRLAIEPSAAMCPHPSVILNNEAKYCPTSASICEVAIEDSNATLFGFHSIA